VERASTPVTEQCGNPKGSCSSKTR
jgi:hypothetical protein